MKIAELPMKPLIEFSVEHYESLLKHASTISFVYFRLKNSVKTDAIPLLSYNVYKAAMLLLVASQYCPDAVPLIDQAIRFARFPGQS